MRFHEIIESASPFIPSRFGTIIDEILTHGMRDPVAARAEARIVLRWLQTKHSPVTEIETERLRAIEEIRVLIRLLG